MPRISAAAHHAGHMLLRCYDFAVRPDDGRIHPYYANLQATDKHIAVFLDHKTGIRDVANLRPELSYWQDVMSLGIHDHDNHIAQQIVCFVSKVVETLNRIPHFSEEEQPDHVAMTTALTTAGAFTVRMNLSKASLEAMEALFYYYEISPKVQPRIPNPEAVKRKVAAMIESCLQIGKAMRALPILRQCDAFLRRGQASADDIRAVLRRVGVLFEFLPSFEFESGTLNRDETKLLA